MAVMNNSKRKAIPVGFLAIFDLIRSREIVQMLFAMARRDIDNGFDYYMKLAEIVLSLERQDLNESDLEDLKDIYRLSKKYKWDWMSRIFGPAGELEQRIDIVLSRIARHIEEIEPGSVTRKRTFWEWFTRKRPWATKRRRKGLEKIESTQKYIEDINRIDSKVPYLFKIKEKERNYRFDYNSIREAVSMNLKEILAIAEEEPEFDYFDILSNMGVVTSIVEARHEQSLKLIEAALKYKLSRPYIYSSDEKDIEKLINMIGEYGDKAGIGILEEAREFISQSKLRFMSKIKARRMIRKAIKKVSRHIIVQMK